MVGIAALCLHLASCGTPTVQRVQHDLDPQEHEADGDADDHHRDRCHVSHLLERVLRDRGTDEPDEEHDDSHHGPQATVSHVESLDTLAEVLAANYRSGDDFVVEFLGHRFEFSSDDFAERVTAAAVRLELVASNDLDSDEAGDLVELVADGRIVEPRSGLGIYLVRHWEHVSLVKQESLVYWLRKLVFRGAWLDHRVKEGLLDVSWEDDTGDFGYAEPKGGRTLLELAPVPSWRELQYRG